MLLLLWPVQPSVHLVWNDPHGLYPLGGRDALSYEVESLFERNGFDVRMHFATRGESRETRPDPGMSVNVVLSPRGATGLGLDESTMAAAVGERSRGFTIFVFLPAVRQTLGHPVEESRPSPARVRELSRGLGRVLAHELIHVLAPARGHARSGLMSRTLTRRLLLDRTVELDAASRRMAHDRLGRLTEPETALPLL